MKNYWARGLVAFVFASAVSPVQAIILFGLGNAANLTDPGTGVPYESVGQIADLGGGNPRASGVYLGNGYVLTANHVGIDPVGAGPQPYVSFDGSTYYQRDASFAEVKVAANVDMKVFRIIGSPTVSAVQLYDGVAEVMGAPATVVGWGVGRTPTVPVNSAVVSWGDDSTVEKRWGLNAPRDLGLIPEGAGFYSGIRTVAGSDGASPAGLGANEAAVTLHDSGSGLFQNIGGTWYLIGLTTSVDTAWISNFGNDAVSGAGAGDGNYFVRVSAYQSDIADIIPEASSALVLVTALPWLLWHRRRRESA